LSRHHHSSNPPRILSAEEFEYLALMGRTQAGDLVVGEGGAERVLRRAKQLALSPDDVLDVYVPGRLRCPSCSFVLTKATIFVQSGQIGASKAEVYQETEPCPNDGTLMDRVTWRQESESNRLFAERLINELLQTTGTQSLPEALELIKDARKLKTEPGTTLLRAWENFSEEQGHAQVEIGPARKAFYAGAQSFCSVMATALDDGVGDEECESRIDAAYSELAKALEELKL